MAGTVSQDNWADVCNPTNRDVWYNALLPELSHPPASAYAYGEQAKFYQEAIWHCPAAKFP